MHARHAVPLSALERTGRAVVTVGDRTVALFRVEGRVFAFENRCPHERNPLADGDIVGDALVCAYHRWRFDLETGACLRGEAPARTYAVEIVGDDVWIDVADG